MVLDPVPGGLALLDPLSLSSLPRSPWAALPRRHRRVAPEALTMVCAGAWPRLPPPPRARGGARVGPEGHPSGAVGTFGGVGVQLAGLRLCGRERQPVSLESVSRCLGLLLRQAAAGCPQPVPSVVGMFPKQVGVVLQNVPGPLSLGGPLSPTSGEAVAV